MKALLRMTATFALLGLCSITVLAQTPEEIIEKYLAATGGRAALGKLTSRTVVGSLTITSPVGDLSGTVEVYSKAPNKSRTLIKLDVPGVGQIIDDQRFDGTAGIDPGAVRGRRQGPPAVLPPGGGRPGSPVYADARKPRRGRAAFRA